MARNRTDNVFGTLTNNPLTNVATTMNSDGLTNMGVISGSQGIITLDPNRVNGAPEIVRVTAHGFQATSATITRGQFGTVARQHPLGTEWVHGPIASNATAYSQPSDDQGDYVPMNEWGSWTPTYTNFTVGSSTTVARFMRIGTTIHYRLQLRVDGSFVMGDIRFSLPVTTDGAGYTHAGAVALGIGIARDVTGNSYQIMPRLEDAISVRALHWSSTNTVAVLSPTVPFTWAAGDILFFSGTYEAAS